MKNKDPRNLLEILTDPNTFTVGLTHASQIMGISRSTAHQSSAKTGYLCEGVPILYITTGSDHKTAVVSTEHLRLALGIKPKIVLKTTIKPVEKKPQFDAADSSRNIQLAINELRKQMANAESLDLDAIYDVIVNSVALLLSEVSIRKSNYV